jgi:hypothetical protein
MRCSPLVRITRSISFTGPPGSPSVIAAASWSPDSSPPPARSAARTPVTMSACGSVTDGRRGVSRPRAGCLDYLFERIASRVGEQAQVAAHVQPPVLELQNLVSHDGLDELEEVVDLTACPVPDAWSLSCGICPPPDAVHDQSHVAWALRPQLSREHASSLSDRPAPTLVTRHVAKGAGSGGVVERDPGQAGLCVADRTGPCRSRHGGCGGGHRVAGG